jgi:hypothetical protein
VQSSTILVGRRSWNLRDASRIQEERERSHLISAQFQNFVVGRLVQHGHEKVSIKSRIEHEDSLRFRYPPALARHVRRVEVVHKSRR